MPQMLRDKRGLKISNPDLFGIRGEECVELGKKKAFQQGGSGRLTRKGCGGGKGKKKWGAIHNLRRKEEYSARAPLGGKGKNFKREAELNRRERKISVREAKSLLGYPIFIQKLGENMCLSNEGNSVVITNYGERQTGHSKKG